MADDVAALALKKLRESSLDLNDAKKLGIEVLKPLQTQKLFPKYSRPTLKLNYYTIAGKLRADTYRVRFLDADPPGSFGEKSKKPLRYLYPPSAAPGAYFPRTIDWSQITEDTGRLVVITEGELKACCAAKYKIPCIGIGGVASWRSSRLGYRLLPELKTFPWAQRPVMIVFDSDVAKNEGVRKEAQGLKAALLKLGAIPQVLYLPALTETGKTGLDDFIIARGSQALEKLFSQEETGDLDLATWLHSYNKRFMMLLDPGVVYDEAKDLMYDTGKFQTALFANDHANDLRGGKTVEVVVPTEWMRWKERRTLDGMTYDPAQPRVFNNRLNEWRAWGCEPKRGSVKLWAELFDHLLTGATPEARAWFESWCFWPIKHPGDKMYSAVNFWSKIQGVGKTLLALTLGKIYGDKNFSEISQGELEGNFNDWAVKKQFIFIDDISSHDARAKADIFKKIITQSRLYVNVKYVAAYQIPDHSNLFLASNRPNVLYLEDQDRRFFVHEVTVKPKSEAFYKAYDRWYKSPDGPAALYDFALHHDFKDFNPRAAPPITHAKLDMTAASRSELTQWLCDLQEAPDYRLVCGDFKYKRDLFTGPELFGFFDPKRKGAPVSPVAVNNAAREVLPVVPGLPLRVNGDASERFFIVRNHDRWSKATPAEVIAHIKTERPKEPGQHKGKKY